MEIINKTWDELIAALVNAKVDPTVRCTEGVDRPMERMFGFSCRGWNEGELLSVHLISLTVLQIGWRRSPGIGVAIRTQEGRGRLFFHEKGSETASVLSCGHNEDQTEWITNGLSTQPSCKVCQCPVFFVSGIGAAHGNAHTMQDEKGTDATGILDTNPVCREGEDPSSGE